MPEFSYMKAAGRSCLKWWFLRCCKESCLTDDQVCDMCNENVSYNNSGMVNEGVILNDDTHSDPCEAKTQAKEVLLLRSELNKARKTIAVMQHRETLMKDRLAQQAQKMLDRGVKFENVCLGERRPTALIRRYGNLYAQARVDTLDVLESFSELQSSDELKSKLLFSVVVDVCSQIWATLYDYPSLKTCEGLLLYVRDCVRLAWGLINQTPPYVISFDTCTFNRNIHVRFHSSNQDSQEIKTYLWPALLEGQNGPCVYKGVVIT
ncbi:uncharacterized protein LOC143253356 isoform X2 [Tachypleus tridentatus]|uniref:uncharacterized protein LOC143253356 isoform X2 n=1 Tax=Tachypleus tridentatus TaxID=6853 RepID=UPI003FD5FEA9